MQGEGESQFEIQRRLLQSKDIKLHEIIEGELKQKELLRAKRNNVVNKIPRIAIIGYTNAGKSKLMN
jgi:GTP-binding protein HflX